MTAVLLTGGTSGIGKAAAAQLVRRGADVTITARDRARGAAAAEEIARQAGAAAGVGDLDLARLTSVRTFAEQVLADHDRLDVLICNAGIMSTDRQETDDGFELMFQVNHLAHFLLVHLLRDLLVASAPARVVVVASSSHRHVPGLDLADLQSEHRYRGLPAYARTKLANVLFTRELAGRLDGTGVTANCVDPGTVRTGWGMDGDTRGLLLLGLRIARPVFRSADRAAADLVHLALSEEVAGETGGYWVRRRRRPPGPAGRNDAAARRLWEASEELLGLA